MNPGWQVLAVILAICITIWVLGLSPGPRYGERKVYEVEVEGHFYLYSAETETLAKQWHGRKRGWPSGTVWYGPLHPSCRIFIDGVEKPAYEWANMHSGLLAETFE